MKRAYAANGLIVILAITNGMSISCGHDQFSIIDPDKHPDLERNESYFDVINGTPSSEDCYDVFFETLNGPSVSPGGWCSSFKVSTGVFITAAHCVMISRPNQSASTWKTDKLTFTNNPWINQRSYVSQHKSLQVAVPPDTTKYTTQQWTPPNSPNSYMIPMDMAVIVTSDTGEPWDTFQNSLFANANIGDYAYVAGYGFGSNDSLGNGIDGQKRRYGKLYTQDIYSIGTILLRGDYQFGTSGDSGGPIYAANAPADNRKIIGIMSAFSIIPSPSNNTAYNYSPMLIGGPYSAWFQSAVQQAQQIVTCLRNQYNNSLSTCLP